MDDCLVHNSSVMTTKECTEFYRQREPTPTGFCKGCSRLYCQCECKSVDISEDRNSIEEHQIKENN